MTETKNYNLNQWDAVDPVRREDYHSDNALIDAALGDHAGRIGTLEQQTAVLGNCRVAVYQYTGTGEYRTYQTKIPYTEKPLVIVIVANTGDFCLMKQNGTTAQACHYTSTFPITTLWTDEYAALINANTDQMQMNQKGVFYCALMFLPPKS